MATEGVYPKITEDIGYASEINAIHTHVIGDGSDHADVAKVTGTLYWTCTGTNFHAQSPDTEAVTYLQGKFTADTALTAFAPVSLPHGAVVTAFVGYGSAGTSNETITLMRWNTSAGSYNTVLAQVNFGTIDTSISSATIDNNNYSYSIFTSRLTATDIIYGAKITYTL